MDSHARTLVKVFSYRTVAALSIFLAAQAMSYGAGFGLKFVIISFTIGFASFWLQERMWNHFKWGKDGLKDLKRRSIVKTITWRMIAFVLLFGVGLMMGLNNTDAVEWSIVTNILFIAVHYLHERAWNLISWGKNKGTTPESDAVNAAANA